MDYERIAVSQEGPVLSIWLDRADKRNAVDQRMLAEVEHAFLAVNDNYDARVVVFGGRGASFCAGADRKAPRVDDDDDRRRRRALQIGKRATRAIEECDIPTIARVQGHAAGGGSCFAVSCDFRITADDTVWWVPEVELGTPLPWAATPRLISEIGPARARQYILLSQRVEGPLAAEWGLAHECVPAAELDTAVDRWVSRVLEMPDFAISTAKSMLRGYSRTGMLGDLSETDGDLSYAANQTADFKARFRDF